ncbi:MAG: hypothetical protein CMF45_00785 [Legionellales bacterium]|nr:hypothetical protein [Legionellales bacterium]|tara:strand:- start:1695 stop:2789 length:1095 start_codon:yes stop_codon:yes gene_type:complete
MARIRRQLTPFSLSFLDIMSCGFGAAVLLFLIIKHNIDSEMTSPESIDTPDFQSEISLLEEEIRVGQLNLVEVKNTIEEIKKKVIITEGLARNITEKIDTLNEQQNALLTANDKTKLDSLKADLVKLEQQKNNLEKKLEKTGEASRQFLGDGDRAYVSGLKMSGKHLLILVDSSASMLDETIVNILRRRNMSEDRKRQSTKWQHTIKIVEWLSAKFSLDSQFQIYHFNTRTNALVSNTKGQWLDVRDKTQLDSALKALNQLAPENGTNLGKAFIAANQLNPKPDNIYLITDGLPTQGLESSTKTTISGKDRVKIFNKAVDKIPARTPINVILTPIEGDPYAAIAFWRLSRATQGSFMSPSRDWP